MDDNGIGMAEALLGLDGFRVLEVTETDRELVVRIETIVNVATCSGCGGRAESQDRVERSSVICRALGVRCGWCGGSAAGDAAARRAR